MRDLYASPPYQAEQWDQGLDPQFSSCQPQDGAGGNFSVTSPAGPSSIQTQHSSKHEGSQRAAPGQPEPCQAGHHTSPREGYPPTPCSMRDGGNHYSPEDGVESPAWTLDGVEALKAQDGEQTPGVEKYRTKPPLSYAQQLHQAFMSTPWHAMTLQEIHQWFRANTDRADGDSKAWKNSIRHNLSLNDAFKLRKHEPSTSRDRGTTRTSTQAKGKRPPSREWYLESWAIKGVKSTTSYRKMKQLKSSRKWHLELRAGISAPLNSKTSSAFSSTPPAPPPVFPPQHYSSPAAAGNEHDYPYSSLCPSMAASGTLSEHSAGGCAPATPEPLHSAQPTTSRYRAGDHSATTRNIDDGQWQNHPSLYGETQDLRLDVHYDQANDSGYLYHHPAPPDVNDDNKEAVEGSQAWELLLVTAALGCTET